MTPVTPICSMLGYGRLFPKTFMEFERRFCSEKACREYLFQLRWQDGFVCPRCQHKKAWKTDRELYHCTNCGLDTSVTAGTIFHGTRKPFQWWLRAMWYVMNQKYGVSALGLQRALGLGSYHTAWTWLHKLRRAMVRPGRDQLTGIVEIDETFSFDFLAIWKILEKRYVLLLDSQEN